jgi:hypothetical protein
LHSIFETFHQSTIRTSTTIFDSDFTVTIEKTYQCFLKYEFEIKDNVHLQLTNPCLAFFRKNTLHASHAMTPKYEYNAGPPQIAHLVGMVFFCRFTSVE